MKRRLLHFDFLRAIAIIFIIVGHIPQYLNNNQIFLIFSPYITILGMGIFVFISGYLIYENNRTINSIDDITTFYKRRIVRIFPLYWIAIILFYAVFAVLIPRYACGQVDCSEVRIRYGFENILIHIAGLQILLSPLYAIPLPALHFIGLIILFYLMYPFFILYSKRLRDIIILSVSVLILFSIIRLAFGIIDSRFFNYFPIFISGVVCCYLDILHNDKYSKYLVVAPIIIVVALLFDLRYASTLNIDSYSPIATLLYTIFIRDSPYLMIAFPIVLLWFAESFLRGISYQYKGIIEFISTASYPVFLFHTPLFYIGFGAAYFLKLMGVLHDVFIIGVVIPIIFVISYIIQKHM